MAADLRVRDLGSNALWRTHPADVGIWSGNLVFVVHTDPQSMLHPYTFSASSVSTLTRGFMARIHMNAASHNNGETSMTYPPYLIKIDSEKDVATNSSRTCKCLLSIGDSHERQSWIPYQRQECTSTLQSPRMDSRAGSWSTRCLSSSPT